MKLSVSLSDDDVEFVDEYARAHGVLSRSAVLQRAIRLLRSADLADEYEAAIDEWIDSGAAAAWDALAADGVDHAAR